MVRSYDGSESDDDSSHFERGVDHIYEAFICPLTKEVMHDPVTLENGRTFEREAIEKYFKECQESGKPPSCPLTSQELSSADVSPSIALRNKGHNDIGLVPKAHYEEKKKSEEISQPKNRTLSSSATHVSKQLLCEDSTIKPAHCVTTKNRFKCLDSCALVC